MGESQTANRDKILRIDWDIPPPFVWVAVALAVAARVALLPFVSEDATIFLLPWMQEFREDGATALGGEFSNYNFPYLLLMFLASLLPVEPLIAIKVASLAGDVLLAVSVAALFAQFRPAGISPKLGAIIALFLPTVLVNASMWGQCDSIYTSFVLLSLRSLLRDDGLRAWLFWGVALSFKLQSVFFLPALLLISLRNRYKPSLPVISIAVWAVLSLPPVLFGRSFASTLSIYINQTQEYRLVAGAANLYAWFPTTTAEQGKVPALVICGLALVFISFAYWRGRDSTERRVLLAVTVLAACPLLLPQMHDRYFYAAEVMSLLLLRQKNVLIVPWFFAATGAYVYVLYFQSNQFAFPLMLASVPQCIAVGILIRALWLRADRKTISSQPLSTPSP